MQFFRRGDANAEGHVNLTDGIATLGYLFLDGATPGCLDAVDTDDSARVEITDAILLLGALFLGQGEVRPPSPGCGADPTPDDIGCRESRCP